MNSQSHTGADRQLTRRVNNNKEEKNRREEIIDDSSEILIEWELSSMIKQQAEMALCDENAGGSGARR